jgi:hypothetical protein
MKISRSQLRPMSFDVYALVDAVNFQSGVSEAINHCFYTDLPSKIRRGCSTCPMAEIPLIAVHHSRFLGWTM